MLSHISIVLQLAIQEIAFFMNMKNRRISHLNAPGLAEDEDGHLARLEEFYEMRFMKDM